MNTTVSTYQPIPLSLAHFPEEIDEQNNVLFYGETSYENQLAVLSQCLHNKDIALADRREWMSAIRSFLQQKMDHEPVVELTDEYISQVAEAPAQYSLFNNIMSILLCKKGAWNSGKTTKKE